MTFSEQEEFVRYCLDFYGPAGIYRELSMTAAELREGLRRRLRNRPSLAFDGDTIDRELVRDEVLTMRGAEPWGIAL